MRFKKRFKSGRSSRSYGSRRPAKLHRRLKRRPRRFGGGRKLIFGMSGITLALVGALAYLFTPLKGIINDAIGGRSHQKSSAPSIKKP